MSDPVVPPSGTPSVEEASAGRRFALVVVPQTAGHRWHALLQPEDAAMPLDFARPLDLLRYLTQPGTSPTPPLDRSRHDPARGRGLR
jgi:hypothetical protein